MKTKIRSINIIISLIIIMGLFTACGQKPAEQKEENIVKQKPDTIVYATPTAPIGTFNPLLSYMGTDNAINDIVYASLLQITPDGGLEPYLAESYEVSKDQKTIMFKLRKDVKWHDGEPFTSKDIEFTYKTIADKNFIGGTDYSIVSKIVGAEEFHNGQADNIEGLKIIDDYTIQLNFKETYAPVLNKLGTYSIIAKHIWEPIAIDSWEKQTKMLNNPIGCGPYKIKKYESGQYVELEAFENYFLGKPKTNKFIVKVVNQDAIAAELVSGNIDIVGVKELKKEETNDLEKKGFSLYSFPDDMYQYISLNLRLPVFQDKNLRQAMAYAIDRPLIVETIIEGRGSLIDTPFLPTVWANPADGVLNTYSQNTDKSIELLEKSGWTDSDGDGIRENSKGEKLQFTLRCSNDSKSRENAVLYVKECLLKIGVDIEVSIEEDAIIADDCIYNHNYEMYALNCYFGQDPDPYFWWHSDSASDEEGVGSFNFGSYKNEKVDENIEKALTTMDQNERKKCYLEVAKNINEDVPMIFLYVQDREMMCNPNLQGFKPSTFNLFYNVYNWELTK